MASFTRSCSLQSWKLEFANRDDYPQNDCDNKTLENRSDVVPSYNKDEYKKINETKIIRNSTIQLFQLTAESKRFDEMQRSKVKKKISHSKNITVSQHEMELSKQLGGAFISRDLAKEDQMLLVTSKNNNVSENSNLPDAKNMWGINLRHVQMKESQGLITSPIIQKDISNLRRLSASSENLLDVNDPPKKLMKGYRSRSMDFLNFVQSESVNEKIPNLALSHKKDHDELFKVKSSLGKKISNSIFRQPKSPTTENKPVLNLEELLKQDEKNLTIDVYKQPVVAKKVTKGNLNAQIDMHLSKDDILKTNSNSSYSMEVKNNNHVKSNVAVKKVFNDTKSKFVSNGATKMVRVLTSQSLNMPDCGITENTGNQQGGYEVKANSSVNKLGQVVINPSFSEDGKLLATGEQNHMNSTKRLTKEKEIKKVCTIKKNTVIQQHSSKEHTVKKNGVLFRNNTIQQLIIDKNPKAGDGLLLSERFDISVSSSDKEFPLQQINKRVGKLIIIPGLERDVQLEYGKYKPGEERPYKRYKVVNCKVLSFESNFLDGLEDNCDNPTIVPEIVFNSTVAGLPSILKVSSSNYRKKTVTFATKNLTTICSYPADSSYMNDESLGTTSSSMSIASLSAYQPTFTNVDIESIVEQELERMHSTGEFVDEDATGGRQLPNDAAEEFHFNRLQEGDHAMLF